MKTNDLLRRFRIKMYFFIITIIVLLSGCGNFTVEHNTKTLTLQEAQKLVSFPICIPDYIPPEIDSTPRIIYDSDWLANVPEEMYIRLQYKRTDNQKLAFEVFQRYTSDNGLKTQYPENVEESILESAKVNLVDWIAYPKVLSDSAIVAAADRVKMESDTYQTKQIIWRFFEIVAPEEYRSTKTFWVFDHVEYRVLAYLSSEKTKEITRSMLGCSTHE